MFLSTDLSEMIDDLQSLFGYHYKYDVKLKPVSEIQLELPGVAKECIKSHVKNEILVVQWLDRHQHEQRKEYYVGKIDATEATYKDGLLSIKITKQKESEGVEIKIKGA
jgi:HSP20 family molecular chaperone IbpA